MLHEVLLALLGHPGSIIQEETLEANSSGKEDVDDGGNSNIRFRIPETITFLAPTERAAINRVVGVGKTYRDLRRFSTLQAPTLVNCDSASNNGSGEEGLYMRALKLGVEELLDEYADRVAELEREVMADPTLTVARVYAGIREYQSVLAAVAEVCATVAAEKKWRGLRGPRVLELVYERSHFGQPDVRRRLCRLVWHCSQVLFNQCFAWLLHGLLLDPHQEFFVSKNVDFHVDPIASKKVAAAIISGGLDNDDDPGYNRHEGFKDMDTPPLVGAGDWRAEEEWNSTYTLRRRLLPTSFFPHSLVMKILFVGKVVRVLRHGNMAATEATDNEGVPEDADISETEMLKLSQCLAELRERDTFNLLALERAVHQAHALVDRRLYNLVMDVSGFERHLYSIKGLFLMGRGGLFHSLFDKARDAMFSPAGNRAVVDLNTWLASAFEDDGWEEDKETDGLDRVRLDLEPPGFECKAFRDLSRQGFCVTGNASHMRKKLSVCLCPGRSSTLFPAKRSPPPRRTPSDSRRENNGGAGGKGSLWYTSNRELSRGFNTLMAFQCDPPPSNASSDGPRPGASSARSYGGGKDCTGSVSFVLHNHRASLGGETDAAGSDGEVQNSLSVRLEPDGRGGGQVSVRQRRAFLQQPEAETPQSERIPERVTTLAQAELAISSNMAFGKVNYFTVDYIPEELRPMSKPSGAEASKGGAQSQSRSSLMRASSRLRVFVNDPSRARRPALSVELELCKHIKTEGGRAFVGVSAAGPCRTTLRQWNFSVGAAVASGEGSFWGPFGGVGSGPRVEKMLEAMDSWSGLCLHYRLEWPLHLILTREAMHTYNRLFRLLALTKITSLELDRMWPILMQTRYRGRRIGLNSCLGPLWMLRTRMAFFVSNLAFHLQVDVVESGYAALHHKLATVRDFVSLQTVHQEYLSKLQSSFYVDNLNISQGLRRALRHVLRFCCLFTIHGDAKDIPPAEVNSLQEAFQDEMRRLAPVLEQVAKELAMRLDFNGHFSAMVP